MARNTRNYSKKDDDKKETVEKLKAQIKNLMKENRILRSENKTLQAAWEKTELYLDELHGDKPLQDVLEYKKFPKEPDKIPDTKRKSDKVTKEEEKEQARLKWKNWNKEKK